MAVITLEITRRSPFVDGLAFGNVGPYHLLEGTMHFALDPAHPRNTAITDLALAPRDASGRVPFTAAFAMLQPVHPERGNRRLFFDVMNRGRKTVLSLFNSAPRLLDPLAPLDPGNGFLMRQGYTVVWVGWQADVPVHPGLLGLQAPEALSADGPLTGKILSQFQVDERTSMLLLADRQHFPHPPADRQEAEALLTVRDHPSAPATVIPRAQWEFVQVEGETEPSYVSLQGGFDPGRIYQLVYTTRGSLVVGLGFAAVRDSVAFLKYASAAEGNPCAGQLDYAYVFGISQSGRFLRQLIYTGMYEDEAERLALDGIIPHVAGGMRGEFNLRFGQPSKDVCYVMPGLFPFTDTPQTDPVTGEHGALLAAAEGRQQCPKIMFTNTSAEYWRGDAALIHTDLERLSDAPESPHVRRYHFAGAQHGSGVFPPQSVRPLDGIRGQLPFNCLDYTPLLRAALSNLDHWVSHGTPPPPSQHPRLSNGTAVPPHTLAGSFTRLPGVGFPPRTLEALRLDFGPETAQGRTLTLPPRVGAPYLALVAAVDPDGNEVAGIRLPDLTVPVATYTGWNLRHPEQGNADLVIGITGGLAGWTLPFPATRASREASGDPRRAIRERYTSQQDYVQQVRSAAARLAQEGYVLEEDIDRIAAAAAQRYALFGQ